jgi:signal transduction histidine kinase
MDDMHISILLVDDEEKIIARLSRILSKEGYDVDMVSSGNQAIERLRGNTYDIILTDLNMPDRSGFEIMEFIQGNGIDTLPLVLTGYASVEGAIQAIKSGAYDFIEKPIDAPTLKLVMKRASERIFLQRQNISNMEELRKLNDLKNEFLSVVSHDLRSPLSTIGGYVNFLMKKGGLDETQKKYLNIIAEISENMYTLVNELLDVSKIETGVIQLNKEDTDIVELLNTSINNFLLLAVDKDNRIEFLNEMSNPVINIDRMKVMQVANNLINNAIKFTEGGIIRVRVSEAGNFVLVSVEDTGVGVPPEAAEALFDKYSYLQNVGTRGERGHGLGLVICKRFVEIHGGTIDVKSVPGEGSTFIFSLPRS